MGWERRKRGGWYYTRSRKVAGRVVREYVGGGQLGEMAAAEDAARRAERQAQADAWRSERECLETVDAGVDELFDTVEAVVRGALMSAGYFRHHRGEWRKRAWSAAR
jgi:hypothetical protein